MLNRILLIVIAVIIGALAIAPQLVDDRLAVTIEAFGYRLHTNVLLGIAVFLLAVLVFLYLAAFYAWGGDLLKRWFGYDRFKIISKLLLAAAEGNKPDALKYLSKLEKHQEDPVLLDLLQVLVAEAMQDDCNAIENTWHRLAEYKSCRILALKRLMVLNLKKGDLDAASILAQKVWAFDKTDQVFANLLFCWFSLKRWQEILDFTLQNRDHHLRCRQLSDSLQAICHYQMAAMDGADSKLHLEKAFEFYPSMPQITFALLDLYLHNNDKANFWKSATIAWKIKPQRCLWRKILRIASQFAAPSLLKHCHNLINAGQQSHEGNLFLAECYLLDGKPQQAIEILEKLLQEKQDYYSLLLMARCQQAICSNASVIYGWLHKSIAAAVDASEENLSPLYWDVSSMELTDRPISTQAIPVVG